jgi:hypothetical protein
MSPFYHEKVYGNAMLGASLVTTTWHILRLWMEETASRYGG